MHLDLYFLKFSYDTIRQKQAISAHAQERSFGEIKDKNKFKSEFLDRIYQKIRCGREWSKAENEKITML